jgi:MFS family permease
LAIVLMYLFNDDIRTVLWFAVIPAVLAVAVLVLGVEEPKYAQAKARAPLKISEIGELGPSYWFVAGAGAVFTLARFSEAFLVIRAKDVGLALAWAPAVIAAMSLVFAASAYPAGRLQDRIGGRPLLILGLATLIAADLVLAYAPSLLGVFIGIGLWGLHMGLTQGVLAALIAATAPERLRGTAFGLFGLIAGLAALIASVLAGLLWDRIGAEATFLAGGAFAAAALIAFLLFAQEPGGVPGKTGPSRPI